MLLTMPKDDPHQEGGADLLRAAHALLPFARHLGDCRVAKSPVYEPFRGSSPKCDCGFSQAMQGFNRTVLKAVE